MNSTQQTKRFSETSELIRKFLKPNSTIVEIGANDASFKKLLLSEENNLSWVTADKYGTPDVLADLNGKEAFLPLEDESIDLVICTEVLEHLTSGSYLVKEITRILKKDGYAIISVPNIVSLKSRIKVLFGVLPGSAASGDCGHPLGGTGYLIDGEWVGGHVVDFNPPRLIGYLKRGGLKVTHHYPVSTAVNIKGKIVHIPHFLIPKNLSDFILVTAQK